MSRILFACFKTFIPEEFSSVKINQLAERLEPDNISFKKTKIISGRNEVIAIFNPNGSIEINDHSICLGNMMNYDKDWHIPKKTIPDGTLALFRSNSTGVEVLTDTVGTRSIWYYHDENKFISATSQRAIIFFLKTFHFNEQVLPWMLATGTLGPGYSWDSRIKLLKGDSSLYLNRQTWKLEVKKNDCVFAEEKRSKHEHQEALKSAIKRSFDFLKLDYSKWTLPLSGGYDCRAILCMLKDEANLTCVTWGLEKSQFEKGNDALVAKKLAEHFGKKHQYYLTNLSDEPVNKILNRFLICGEGRVGDIGGYLDGFSIWKDLFEHGIQGIVRGDEGFGGQSIMTALDVRKNMRIPLLSDYANLNEIHDLGIPEQKVPVWLNRKEEESMDVWRDRIYYEYEMPIAFAALNDLKLAFVEVINPLLTREILSVVKSLPDQLRTNKKLFKDIMHEICPNIEYATKDATATLDNIFSNEALSNEIINELQSENEISVVPPEFISYLLRNLESSKNTSISSQVSFKSKLKKILPSKVKSMLRSSFVPVTMDYKILAFRTYIIIKMNRLLSGDASQSDRVF